MIDNCGRNTECFAFNDTKYTPYCEALKDWYNVDKKHRCTSCKFFKTREQIEKEWARGKAPTTRG